MSGFAFLKSEFAYLRYNVLHCCCCCCFSWRGVYVSFIIGAFTRHLLQYTSFIHDAVQIRFGNGPRQANLVLIAYASSEGSGEPAHPRSLARTFAARSYKQ